MDDEEITIVQSLGSLARSRAPGYTVLTVLSGRELGRTHRLTAAETLIGRGADVDLLIDDDGVSRRHAKVVRETDGTLKIHDLSSTNGTYVNGKRIMVEALREGDLVRIGRTATLEVRVQQRETAEDLQLAASAPSIVRQDLGGPNAEVLAAYRRTLAIREENLGADHPSVASVYAEMGKLLRASGDHVEALRHHQRALEIHERRVGNGSAPPEMAHLLTEIGQCHLDRGDAETALEVLEQALEMLWERRASDRELVDVRFALARALHAASQQPVRMRSLANMARDAAASAPNKQAVVVTIDRWLAALDDE